MYIATLFYLGLIGPLTINAQNHRATEPEDTTTISYPAYPININKESSSRENSLEGEQIQYGREPHGPLEKRNKFQVLLVSDARSNGDADLKRRIRHNLREITDSVNESSGTGLPKPFIKTSPSLGYRPPPPPVRREIIMAPRCNYDTDKWALHPQSTITYATMFERSTGGSCEECLKRCVERQDGPWSCRSVVFDSNWKICDLFAIKGTGAPFYLVDYEGRDYFEFLAALPPSKEDVATVNAFVLAQRTRDDTTIISCETLQKNKNKAAGVKTIRSLEVNTNHETVLAKDQQTTEKEGIIQIQNKEKRVESTTETVHKEIPGINVHSQQIGDEVEAMVEHVMNEEKSIEKELSHLSGGKKPTEKIEDQQGEKMGKGKKEIIKASEESKHGKINETREIILNDTKKSGNLKKTFLRYQHHIQTQQARKNYKLRKSVEASSKLSRNAVSKTNQPKLSTETIPSSTTSDIGEVISRSTDVPPELHSAVADNSEENSQQTTKEIKEERTLGSEEREEGYRLHSMGSFEDVEYNEDIMLEAYNALYENSKSNKTPESSVKLSRNESYEISSEIFHESVCADEDRVIMVEFPSATRQPFKADIKKVTVNTIDQCTDLCERDEDCSAAIYSTKSCELASTLARHSRPELYPSLNCSYIEKACIPQTVIRGHSSRVTGVADHILAGHVEEVEDVLSLEQCISACLQARSRHGFHCLSAMWYPMDRNQNCLLNSESRKSKPKLFIPEEVGLHMVYFELSDANSSKQISDAKIRRLDTPGISSQWTFWSSCDGKSEDAMRFRYMKCSEKYDIRQCPKETAFCGSNKLKGPLVRKIDSPKI